MLRRSVSWKDRVDDDQRAYLPPVLVENESLVRVVCCAGLPVTECRHTTDSSYSTILPSRTPVLSCLSPAGRVASYTQTTAHVERADDGWDSP